MKSHPLQAISPLGPAEAAPRRGHKPPAARVNGMRGGSVSRILSGGLPPLDDHSSASAVTGVVKLPTRAPGLKVPRGGLRQSVARLESGPFRGGAPIRHCSGWGLPYRPGCPVRGGLLPHRFTITPDPPAAGRRHRSRLFSVALSLGLPPPGVTRHPSFMESGLSSGPPFRALAPRSSNPPREEGLRPARPGLQGAARRRRRGPTTSTPGGTAPGPSRRQNRRRRGQGSCGPCPARRRPERPAAPDRARRI